MRALKHVAGLGLLAVVSVAQVRAQEFVWAKQLGGSGVTQVTTANQVALDSNGNVYTVGELRPQRGLRSGTRGLHPDVNGNSDGFISKLDSAGEFVWATKLGGTNTDFTYSVALDSDGNVYTVGRFIGTVDFDPGPGAYNLTAAGGSI